MTDEQKDPIAIEQGRRLRVARERRGWSQRELSEATGWREEESTGFSPSRIGNYEQGTRRLGREEADVFEAIFPEFPAAYFLGVVSEQEARVLITMRTPPDPARQVI